MRRRGAFPTVVRGVWAMALVGVLAGCQTPARFERGVEPRYWQRDLTAPWSERVYWVRPSEAGSTPVEWAVLGRNG